MNRDDMQAGVAKIPGVQLLNDGVNFGLFIKPEALKACGWLGATVPHSGVETEHQYNDNSVVKGILFKYIHMHILLQSHRYIEVKDISVAPGSKKGDTLIAMVLSINKVMNFTNP